MKRKLLSYIQTIGLTSVMIAAASCTSSTNDGPPPVDAKLEVTPTTLNFTTAGESKTATLVANNAWTAAVSADASWCSITPASGKENAALQITTTPNTDMNVRTTTVTITSGTLSKTVTVTQLGEAPGMLVDQTPIFVESGSGTIGLSVTTNVPYTITQDAAWLTTAPSVKTMVKYDHVFTYGANSGKAPRTASVVFKQTDGGASALERTIKIQQTPAAPEKAIALGVPTSATEAAKPVETTASESGSMMSLTTPEAIQEVVIPTGIDWVSVVPSASASMSATKAGDPMRIIIDANSGAARKTSVIFKQPSRQDTLVINQAGKEPSYAFSPSHISLADSAQTVRIEVLSNVRYKASADDYWISDTPTQEAGDSSGVYFSVEKNYSGDDRKTSIKLLFEMPDGQKTETITLVQRGTPTVDPTDHQINVGSDGGRVVTNIWHNMNYEVIIPKDAPWISLSPLTKQMVVDSLSFYIAPNESNNDRSAKVVLKSAKSKSDTILIKQFGNLGAFIRPTPSVIDLKASLESEVIKLRVAHNVPIGTDYQILSNWISSGRFVSEGDSITNMEFSAQPHFGDSVREGVIALVSYDNSRIKKIITVRQQPNIGFVPILNVPKSIDIPATSKDTIVNFDIGHNNRFFTVELTPREANAWMRFYGTHKSDTVVNFETRFSLNPDDTIRKAIIRFTSADKKLIKEIQISQTPSKPAGGFYIKIDPEDMVYSARFDTTLRVVVKSNSTFDVSTEPFTRSEVQLIYKNQIGPDTHEAVFHVRKDIKQGSIKFSNNNVKQTFNFTNTYTEVLPEFVRITPDNISLNKEGGDTKITITHSSKDYKLSSNANWINIGTPSLLPYDSTSRSYTSTLNVSVGAYNGGAPRMDSIRVILADGSNSLIHVGQMGALTDNPELYGSYLAKTKGDSPNRRVELIIKIEGNGAARLNHKEYDGSGQLIDNSDESASYSVYNGNLYLQQSSSESNIQELSILNNGTQLKATSPDNEVLLFTKIPETK